MIPVLRGIGYLLHIPAAMAVLSIAVCWAAGEPGGIAGFVITASLTLPAGQVLLAAARGGPDIERRHAMQVAAVAWLVIPLAGALPFRVSAMGDIPAPVGALAPFRDFLGAYFEAVSGFTATGLTLAPAPQHLPAHLQWWRSFSEWVGGIGVVVLLLTLLSPGRSSLHLFFSEARTEKIFPTVTSTARTIWVIYLLYTAAGAGLLRAAGAPPWEALNHAMTAIATGGFTITADSLAHTGSAERAVYLVLMVLGAISFAAHYRILRLGDVRSGLWGSTEMRLFWGLLLLGTGAVMGEALFFDTKASLGEAAFEWVSALTTAGLSTAPPGAWHPGLALWLVLAMLVGANAGSTGGAIKQARLAVLLKNVAWSIQGLRRTPHEVVRHGLNGARLSDEEAANRVRAASELTVAYLLALLASVLALLHLTPQGTPLERVFFEAASAQGNVGLSSGLTHAGLPPGAKAVLIAQMWVGRLEIFPALVLVAWLSARR